jgi:hypothetical protein
MTEKEKLIQELESRHTYGVKGILDTEIVVNFIIEDRKRICKPIVKSIDKMQKVKADTQIELAQARIKILCLAIDEMLVLAGLGN